jgi:hypothetical protein
MFILRLFDREGTSLAEGDYVAVSNSENFSFYAEVKYIPERYIIENKVTRQQQNVGEEELAAIQKNPRVSNMWFVKEKLPGAITKNIPPANVKVNGDAKADDKKPYNEMSLEELKAECDLKGIKYKKTAKEVDLLTLLGLE